MISETYVVNLYDIYKDTEFGYKLYMFSPDSDITTWHIDINSVDNKLKPILIEEKSPLLYVLCLSEYIKFKNLANKLFIAIINKYQNNIIEYRKFVNYLIIRYYDN
jgi:hypothetical protein